MGKELLNKVGPEDEDDENNPRRKDQDDEPVYRCPGGSEPL